MKIFYIIFFIIAGGLSYLVDQSNTFAALHVNCYNSGMIVGYGNIYHENSSSQIGQKSLHTCYGMDEYNYQVGQILKGNTGSNNTDWSQYADYLEQVIPIYNPKQSKPVLIQTVMSRSGYDLMMISLPPSVLLGYRDKCEGIRLSYKWLNLACGHMYTNPERADIYFLSQQKPYISAHKIQFYLYKLGILVVARDETGKVTHWMYEKKKHNITEKQIQYFLGDKWYHP